jgi:Flp pilus assembly pilin Flp
MQMRGQADAQNAVEYGLLIAFIAVVVLLAINSFGHEVMAWFMPLAVRITTSGG